MDKYFLRQLVFAFMIMTLILFMLPVIVGLAVVACFALVFLMYKRWRSNQ